MVMRNLVKTAATSLALLLAACGGGGGSGGSTTVGAENVVAEAEIGPGGGALWVQQGEASGLSLTVPPGTVAVPTRFRVLAGRALGEIPAIFPTFSFEPEGLILSGNEVTLTIPASEAFFVGGVPQLTVFSRDEPGAPWSALQGATLNVAERTVTVSTDRLGEFVAWEGNLHRLFTQPHGFIDPAVLTKTEFVAGVEVIVANGAVSKQVGQGSLNSFWSSPASDNVVVLHGAFGSPLDFLGAEDLVENLRQTHANVLLYSYPSARGTAYAANQLYDLIVANRRPGFGCRLVGHSLGALIGRYLVERSHLDTERDGYAPGDPQLDTTVDRVVMMAPPNAGAAVAVASLQGLFALLAPQEQPLLQVVSDLDETPNSLPIAMNAGYVDNASLYHIVYGDLGGGTDGVVPVASALALPLGLQEQSAMFVAQHDDLHRAATSLGVGPWIRSVLLGP